jgi:hypothetical protein
MLDTADRQEDQVAELRVNRLRDRLEALRVRSGKSDNGTGGRGCAGHKGSLTVAHPTPLNSYVLEDRR